MRVLAFLLLLANLAFLAWFYLQPPHQSAPVPATEPGVEPLRILADGGAAARRGESTAPGVRTKPDSRREIPPSAAAATSAPACFSAGPFPSAPDADEVAGRMRGLGMAVSQRSVEIREPSGYRVYIPPLPDRDAAVKLSEQLAVRGITDYLIVITDELQNAISLGVYMDAAGAEQRKSELAAAGFEAVIEQRFINRTEFWLDYKELTGHPLGSEFWAEVTARMPRVQQVPRICE